MTTRLSISTPVRRLGTLTAGSEVYHELPNLQVIFQTTPAAQEYFRISRPNRGIAIFAQQEVPVTKRWRIYAGLRQDYSRNFQGFTAPRVSAVFDQNDRLTYKLSYARAFRNPSTYEKYYEDDYYQVLNLNLRQERTNAFEASLERRLGKQVNAVLNTFHYRMKDVIQSELTANELNQYRNGGQIRLSGVEAELNGSLAPWMETSASAVIQRADNITSGSRLVNSPSVLGKARLGIPVLRRRGNVGFAVRSWNSRLTGSGQRLAPVALLEHQLHHSQASFRVSVGCRHPHPDGAELRRSGGSHTGQDSGERTDLVRASELAIAGVKDPVDAEEISPDHSAGNRERGVLDCVAREPGVRRAGQGVVGRAEFQSDLPGCICGAAGRLARQQARRNCDRPTRGRRHDGNR